MLTRYELDETVKVQREATAKRLKRSCNRLHEAEIETFVCATVEVELEEMPLETREHFNVFRSGECLDLITHEIQSALDAVEVDYDDLYAGWEEDNPDTFFVKVYAPVETDVGAIVASIKEVLSLEEVEVEETDESTNTSTAVKALLVSEGKRVFMRFFDAKGARTVGPASLRATLSKFAENNRVPLWVSRTGDVLVLSKVKEALEVLRKAASEISLKLEDATTANVIELIAPGVLSGPDDPIAPSAKANAASPYEAEDPEKQNTDDKPADDDYDVKVSEEIDPNVPTGVNVIPQDGKFIVYSDGMDKMLAGPFDTEIEAETAMAAILDASAQNEGGDYDVAVAGMQIGSSVGEGTEIPAIALGPNRKPLQKGDTVWTYSQKTQKQHRWNVLVTPLPALGNKVLARNLDTGVQRDLMPGEWARNPGDLQDLPFYAGMFDDRGMPIEWPLESKVQEADSVVSFDMIKKWSKLKPYGFGEKNVFHVLIANAVIGIVKKYEKDELDALTNPAVYPAEVNKRWAGAKPGWAALLFTQAKPNGEPIANSLASKEAAVDALLRASYEGKGQFRPVTLTGFPGGESVLKEDARDHFALVNGTLYGDTGAIYAAEKMSDRIDHLGFGDFAARGVSLGSYGTVDVQFIRADGTTTGNKLMAAGFVGRPHALSFDGARSGSEKDWAQAFAKMLRAAGVTEVSLGESGPKPTKPMRNEGAAVDAIRPGSRVTIRTPQGQERSGKAVMRSSYGGWVLNMGGPHGTPGLADDGNIVAVDGKRFTPTDEAVSDDPDIEAWKDDVRRGTLAPISTKTVVGMVKNRIIRRAPIGKIPSVTMGRSPGAGKNASYEVRVVVDNDELPWVVPTIEPVQGGYGLYEPKGGAGQAYTVLIIHHNTGSAQEGTFNRVKAALAKAAPNAQEIAADTVGMKIADKRWVMETDSADVSAGSAEVAPIKKPDDEAGDGEIVKPNAEGPSPIIPVIGEALNKKQLLWSLPDDWQTAKPVWTGMKPK